MPFSADWLALREPADSRARDEKLMSLAVSAAGAKPVIMDLGCGTGSTIRALKQQLPSNTEWRLVDNDPALLEIAAKEAPDRVTIYQLDLADVDQLPVSGVTMITASALLDLVSKDWLEDFLKRVSVPVYFALTYNGSMNWIPNDDQDPIVTKAFNAHQQTDKGLGLALGPNASEVAIELLEDSGFKVLVADSPWKLDSENTLLQEELLRGISEAAGNSGADSTAIWLANKLSNLMALKSAIGHRDILAFPSGFQVGGN